MKTGNPAKLLGHIQRARLLQGQSLSGIRPYVPRTDAANYVWNVIAQAQDALLSSGIEPLRGEQGSADWVAADERRWDAALRIAITALALAPARADMRHYRAVEEEPSPQRYVDLDRNAGRAAIYPDPQFSHCNLLHTVSPARMKTFRTELGIPSSATFAEMLTAAGLLDADWACREALAGHLPFATYLVGQAFECSRYVDRLRWKPGSKAGSIQELKSEIAKEHGSLGGKAAAESRQRDAKLKPDVALREFERLLATRERHEIAGMLAAKFGVTAKHVRAMVKKGRSEKENP